MNNLRIGVQTLKPQHVSQKHETQKHYTRLGLLREVDELRSTIFTNKTTLFHLKWNGRFALKKKMLFRGEREKINKNDQPL